MSERPVDLYGEAPREDVKPRCWRCNRLLAENLTRPWAITCVRCKAKNSPES